MKQHIDNSVRLDYQVICELVHEGASVLDLGCGDGELLSILAKNRRAAVQGIEVDEQWIYRCVEKGVNVHHGDIDTGLSEYEDGTFDYIIFNQSIQQVKKPEAALAEAMRVGRAVIVGFPNFAQFSARLYLFLKGKTPMTPALPHRWWDTPNLRFLTIADFVEFCRTRAITIVKSVFISKNRRVTFLPNLMAEIGIFLIQAEREK